MNTTECIACGSEIKIKESQERLGYRVICEVCESEFEIVWLNPIELDWPFDEEETYDVYSDEYDY